MKKDTMKIKNATSWTVFVYGLLLISLGIWAYVKVGSKISLFMALGFGGAILVSSILMFAEIWLGRVAAFTITALLALNFLARYLMTQKTTPAILALLSGAMLIFLIARAIDWKKKSI